MKTDNLEALIMDYWDDHTRPDRKKEIEEILKKEGYSKKELSELKKFYSSLDTFSVPEPGPEMTTSFYQHLHKESLKEREKQERWKGFFKWWNTSMKMLFPKVGYAFLFLFIGWFLGFWVTPSLHYEKSMNEMAGEIRDMKEMVALNLLQQSSSTDRIKAVNLVHTWDGVNNEVVAALLKTLNNDSNINVRLVTVETLSHFVRNPQVREGLIRSIVQQESPLVQLALADLMAGLDEKESVPYFRQLLEKKDLNYAVRDRIEEVITML